MHESVYIYVGRHTRFYVWMDEGTHYVYMYACMCVYICIYVCVYIYLTGISMFTITVEFCYFGRKPFIT